MYDLQVFEYGLSEVRTLTKDGEVWFIAKDVCEVLGIINTTQAMQKLDEDERSMLNIGRQGVTNVINEYGLYTLVLTSRKPEAKQFKRWITHEVIPSIRKIGSYSVQNHSQSDMLALSILNANDKVGMVLAIREYRDYEVKVAVMPLLPKVEFVERYVETKGTYTISEVAKVIGHKPHSFSSLLRECGILFKRGNMNIPIQKFIDKGYFTVKLRSLNGIATEQTRVTPLGVEYLTRRFLSNDYACRRL